MSTNGSGSAAPGDIGERTRALRHAANANQTHIATQTGVSVNSLQGWESGAHIPSPRYWPKLAKALNVPLDALFAPWGWAVLPTPWLRPETLASLADPEAFEATYRAICARMREALEQARPLTPVPAGRRRRSREEVLQAQAERLAALSARGNKKRRRELR